MLLRRCACAIAVAADVTSVLVSVVTIAALLGQVEDGAVVDASDAVLGEHLQPCRSQSRLVDAVCDVRAQQAATEPACRGWCGVLPLPPCRAGSPQASCRPASLPTARSTTCRAKERAWIFFEGSLGSGLHSKNRLNASDHSVHDAKLPKLSSICQSQRRQPQRRALQQLAPQQKVSSSLVPQVQTHRKIR